MRKENLDLSLIIPCLNEEGNLPELIKRVMITFGKMGVAGELVLVDDGSTDGTAQVMRRLKKRFPFLVTGFHQKNRGIESAWRTGLKASLGGYICVMDADLQYQPEDVLRLFRELKWSGVDVVQGWRSQIGRIKDLRYFISRSLNLLLNFLFAMSLQDNKSGFILCRREVFRDILTTRFRYKYFQTFITVAAKYKGYSIKEVEALFEKRILGKPFIGKFPVKVIGWTLVDLLKAFVEYRILKTQKRDDPVLVEFLKQVKLLGREEKLEPWRQLFFKFYLLLMPLHHWMIDKKAADDYHLLKKSQWLAPEEISKLQFIKLKKLLSHAYNHVEFYKERFEKLNVTPDDIGSIEDFRELPFLTKKDLRERLFFDLFSDNHNKGEILKITTSGSTGEPLVFYADKKQLNIRWATTLRAMEWAGYRWGDRQLRLWHQTIGMTKSQVFKEKLDAFLSRRLFVPAYEMTEGSVKEVLRRIRDYQPIIIDGYAESFNLLANYLKFHPLKGLRPRGIISSAQTLPPQSRRVIEESFNCKVFDKYGSREFSGIAYECDAHQGHHVSAESYLVELIKNGRPARPGEIGEVIITDLNNFCVPLIRYRIGDLAQAVDNSKICPCGRGLPRLGEIKGRTQAIIVGPGGQYVPGTFFAHLLKDYGYAIGQFQVIQTKVGEIEMKVVKGGRFNDKTLQEVLAQIKKYLGEDLKIKVKYAEEIPLGRTGKHQHNISKLDIDFQSLGGKNG